MNTIANKQLMPTLFVSHGSPMLAIDTKKSLAYRQWGMALPKPKAILVFSAHWESQSLAFGEIDAHNELIYDFYGFPDKLYTLKYPAPGSPRLIEKIQTMLGDSKEIPVLKRGLDHGVWVPFMHLWPEADTPIVQMTMPSNMSNRELFELGVRLSPLREQGVLIVGSGMLTHNLKEWNSQQYKKPVDWVKTFDGWVAKTLVRHDVDGLLKWESRAPNATRNHPTPEHFRPLLLSAGAAITSKVSFPITGFEAGIFSIRSVQFD